jgi:hypothetical protein
MSKWEHVTKDNIEINGDLITFCLESDDDGSRYAEAKISDVMARINSARNNKRAHHS